MRNQFITGVLGLISLFLCHVSSAAESEAAGSGYEAGIISETGQVQGYFALGVDESNIPATLIPDQTGSKYGKLLILHDSDGGMASPGLVNDLRFSLAESGWTTMTIALDYPEVLNVFRPNSYVPNAQSSSETPIAETVSKSEATSTDSSPVPDNVSRVAAALAYLNAQQNGPTVIVALGQAVSLAMGLAEQQGKTKGQIWLAYDQALPEESTISPVLDIVPAAFASATVAQNRRLKSKTVDSDYSQQVIKGAGHDFQGFENQVLSLIKGWLRNKFVPEAKP